MVELEVLDIAIFKCPNCGFEEKIEIPKDRCILFHKCKNCNELISTPESGCCIICSYTDKKCPVSDKNG